MGLVDIPTAAAGALTTSPFGSATPGPMAQILEILKVINDIVHSPLAQRFIPPSQQQPQGVITQLPPSQPGQAAQQLPGPAAASPAASDVFNEQTLLAILGTPDGREKFARGIEAIILAIGDVKLSEVVAMLRTGELTKPTDKKPGLEKFVRRSSKKPSLWE